MRGSPLIQAALVIVGLLLLLFPLHSLTQRHATIATPAVAPRPAKRVQLSLRTTAPCRFHILYLGQVVWEGTDDSTDKEITKDLDIDFPKEGIDLAVDVTWETKGLAAAEISATVDGSELHKTLWGQGSASEVVTFTKD
jgi:hypothetical protein